MTGPSRSQFSVAGVPVRVEPAFFVIIALLGATSFVISPWLVVSWVVIAFVSILVHELGHAFAFRAFGIAPDITLHGFGGLTTGSGNLSPARHIVVSLAGPVAALCLLGLPAVWLASSATPSSRELELMVQQAVWINVGWSALNLLPILPLDGGHVFVSVLDLLTGGRGRRAAEVVSVVVAVGMALVALRYGFVFGALLAAMFAGINLTAISKAKADELGARLHDAHRFLLAHRAPEAERLAARVLSERPSGATLAWASELLAWTRLWQGDLTGADEALRRYEHAGQASASFRGARALAAGRTTEGVATLAWALANEPAGPAKSLGAVAAAGAGEAAAVARELLLLGDQGVEGAQLFRQLLDYAGYHRDAAQVGALLAGPG
jgi:stage IV sporulation protein FB